MKGQNTIKLNQSTMNEAIEYWLNETQLKESVTVKSIDKEVGSTKSTYNVVIEPDIRKEKEVHHG